MELVQIKNITPHKHVNDVLFILSKGITEILVDNVIGIYLFGSLTYEDFNLNRSDIDLLVVTKDFLSDKDLGEIKKFHLKLEEDFKEWKERIECSYTPLEMFKNKLPINLHRPYFGAGVFYPAATYGNEWLINNYLVYKHGIALVGPDIKTLIKPVDIKDIQKASAQDLYKEWVPKITDEKWLQNSHYQSYLILNLCRILHTVLNGEASSKTVSAEWVKSEFPQWENLIQTAQEWEYGREMKLQRETIDFIKFTVSKIDEAKIY
jgi:predicted nucleotidyltransferase